MLVNKEFQIRISNQSTMATNKQTQRKKALNKPTVNKRTVSKQTITITENNQTLSNKIREHKRTYK